MPRIGRPARRSTVVHAARYAPRAGPRSSASGFTLIELAVVVAIVGLLLGGLLLPLATQVNLRRVDETEKQLSLIREALYGFAISSTPARLPCPDTDAPPDGRENVDGAGDCVASEGNLPWVDLGVSSQDAWGQTFLYRVTGSFADTTDGSACPGGIGQATLNVSFQLCSTGDITIQDGAGNNVATSVPAIVVSAGAVRSRDPTTSPLEDENTNNDTVFVSRQITNQPGSEFDDMVTWVSRNVLANRMLQAARLP